MDYTIKRELTQIYGEIERQLGVLKKPVKNKPLEMANSNSGDFEKIINEQYARLTDVQKTSITQKMRIHRIN